MNVAQTKNVTVDPQRTFKRVINEFESIYAKETLTFRPRVEIACAAATVALAIAILLTAAHHRNALGAEFGWLITWFSLALVYHLRDPASASPF